MVYHSGRLDVVFGALADPTRRAVLARLRAGDASVGELAGPFDMSLPGFLKHLGILEDARLIERHKVGRVVHCRLAAGAMKEAREWLDRYEAFWTTRLDRLEALLQRKEKATWPSQSTKRPARDPAGPPRPRRRGLRGVDGPAAGEPVDGAERRLRPDRGDAGRARRRPLPHRHARPDGETHRVGGTYEEVIPNRRLVYTWAWESTPERQSRVRVEFRPVDEGTELLLVHDRFFDTEARDKHQHGWQGCMGRFERYLSR
jgi:uncharacterized protein YndB with AHSA1/START domain